jgi:hypothetical protein
MPKKFIVCLIFFSSSCFAQKKNIKSILTLNYELVEKFGQYVDGQITSIPSIEKSAAHKKEFSYEGNLIKKTIYHEHGGISDVTNVYLSPANLTDSSISKGFAVDGTMIYINRDVHVYDKKRRVSGLNRKEERMGYNSIYKNTIFGYDKNDNVISKKCFINKDSLIYDENNFYDSDGLLIMQKFKNSGNIKIERFEDTLVVKTFRDQSDSLLFITRTRLNQDNLIKVIESIRNNIKTEMTFSYLKNKNGDWIERKIYFNGVPKYLKKNNTLSRIMCTTLYI